MRSPRAGSRRRRGSVDTARRWAWTRIEARHGAVPGIRIADKVLEGVIGVRLDATVTPAHSDKEGAQPNFKGFGHHPLLSYCDNLNEPLVGMMRPGSAGSNTTSDHVELLAAAIAAVPPTYRRRLMVTVDGAGASHGLVTRLDELASRPGCELTYSVGWELGDRERTAIAQVPGSAWQIASLMAATLLSWLAHLGLDGELARAEPKTLRYRVLSTAARLVRGGRCRRLKVSATWPWAQAIADAWDRISALPQAP